MFTGESPPGKYLLHVEGGGGAAPAEDCRLCFGETTTGSLNMETQRKKKKKKKGQKVALGVQSAVFTAEFHFGMLVVHLLSAVEPRSLESRWLLSLLSL